MEYPKKIMTISEMTKMGYTRYTLMNFVHIPGQKFAFRSQGGGKWYFDVDEFDKFIRRNCMGRTSR